MARRERRKKQVYTKRQETQSYRKSEIKKFPLMTNKRGTIFDAK
jgi:hypothetical protein